MSDTIKDIKLSFQCPMDWNSMKDAEGGKYCDSCKHIVHDFTNARPCEVKALLESNTRVCGRFKRSQMSANFLKYAAATVIAASGVAANSCMEEEIKPVIPGQVPSDLHTPPEFEIMGVIYYAPDSITTKPMVREENLDSPETTE